MNNRGTTITVVSLGNHAHPVWIWLWTISTQSAGQLCCNLCWKGQKKKKIGKNPHSAEKHMKKQHSKFFQELEVGMGFSWIWIQFGIGISWTESRGNNKINKN